MFTPMDAGSPLLVIGIFAVIVVAVVVVLGLVALAIVLIVRAGRKKKEREASAAYYAQPQQTPGGAPHPAQPSEAASQTPPQSPGAPRE